MQNNKSIEEEVNKNNNNVFMSEELNNLFDFSDDEASESIKIQILAGESKIETTLVSKMAMDDIVLLKFILSLENIIHIESGDINSLVYVYKDRVIKEYNSKSYIFDVSWCQQNNKYEVDIFINKRGK